MTVATLPRVGALNRLLVVEANRVRHDLVARLDQYVRPGDVWVVNDAATLPASLPARFAEQELELRLVGPPSEGWAVLFGPGSWRDDTERRAAPPRLVVGDRLKVGNASVEVVEMSPVSPRLLRVALPQGLVWKVGRPVQYSYMERELALHEVQTPYAQRPWAVEMPSAGRPLDALALARLRAAGAQVVSLTHAAGLSSTGDPALDAALPLPERYEVPTPTWDAVQGASRVIAVGTSVVRALETASLQGLSGISSLRVTPTTRLQVVDGLLSGMHEPGESHFQMMAAFISLDRLRRACEQAAALGYRNHEFGDSTLLLRAPSQ